ncbi:hypothetical protein UlMin_009977 [Ulmus minor]
MLPWSLRKKLSPAKKAWKTFKAKLQPKLQKLTSLPKSIKNITHQLFSFRFISFRFFISSKFRAISKPYFPSSSRRNYNYNQQYYHHNMPYKNFEAIHIDELFAEPNMVKNLHNTKYAEGETSNKKGKQVVDDRNEKVLVSKSKSVYSVDDAWKAVVASSPQLRGVDERAEEFICNFRQEMKLQKERSILEFQEMLARSA